MVECTVDVWLRVIVEWRGIVILEVVALRGIDVLREIDGLRINVLREVAWEFVVKKIGVLSIISVNDSRVLA